MRKLFYFMLIAVFMTAFTSQGFAQEETTTSKKMVKVHHGELAECCSLKDLQLTDKQKAKIDQMKKVFAEDQKKLREKLAKLQGELHKLMEAEKPKKESINKKLEEIGNLEIVCKKMLVNHKLEFHALLTPEQLKKAKEIHGKACCAKSHGQKAHHWHAKQGFDCCAKDHNCSAKTHECCRKLKNAVPRPITRQKQPVLKNPPRPPVKRNAAKPKRRWIHIAIKRSRKKNSKTGQTGVNH